MICLYNKDDSTFTGNGICVLEPSVCTVHEIAGGSYTLHMEHPVDDNGKYAMLTDERIIKAPVPPTHIPAFTLPYTKVLKTTASTNLYSRVPTTRTTALYPADVMAAMASPSSHAWDSGTTYSRGAVVVYDDYVYRANMSTTGDLPGSGPEWSASARVTDERYKTEYIAGTVLEILAADTVIYKITDASGNWIEIRTVTGSTGYIDRNASAEVQTEESGLRIEAQDITDQLFRIYKVEYEDDADLIVVEAKHISYDFQGNALLGCKLKQAEPAIAISLMRNALIDYDGRTIVSNIRGQYVTQDWSFLNPINALLDPDSGLVPTLGAALVRNNKDFYILDNSNPRFGIDIRYGSNLKGVKWSRDLESVITRVFPRCGNGNSGYLYIDGYYVQSSIASEYAYQRTEMLDCNYAVGDEYERADGTVITLDEASAKAQMRTDAQNRFDVDKVDAVQVEFEVDFLLLGDTEEFKQYRDMQRVSLYDLVTIRTGKSGIEATAQVVEYEYDSILKRFNSIRVGDIKNLQYRIPGYRMRNSSITMAKLGQDVVSKIRSSV